MKKKAAITAVVLAMIMLLTQYVFAESPTTLIAPASQELEITGTVPKDTEKGKQLTNFAVKIKFNEDMSLESNDAFNASHIVIKDAESGKVYSFQIKHHPKYPNELWCILEGNLEANTKYQVVVGEGIKAASGNTLSEAYSFTFSTRNTKVDNTVSLLLTFGMMGVMFIATASANKKQQENNAQNGKQSMSIEKIAQADPYRLAKEKGISVDQAKAEIAKEKAKLEKKNSSAAKAKAKYEENKAAREAAIEKRMQELHDASVYKVKNSGSVTGHGYKLPKGVVKKLARYSKQKK